MKLSDEDLKAIGDLVRAIIAEMDVVSKKDLSFLPTKDEFYTETAKIYKKMEDIEESLDIVNARSSENRDRVENLEKIHPDGQHTVAT